MLKFELCLGRDDLSIELNKFQPRQPCSDADLAELSHQVFCIIMEFARGYRHVGDEGDVVAKRDRQGP